MWGDDESSRTFDGFSHSALVYSVAGIPDMHMRNHQMSAMTYTRLSGTTYAAGVFAVAVFLRARRRSICSGVTR